MAVLLAPGALAGVAAAAPAPPLPNPLASISVHEGTTTLFGGGDYLLIGSPGAHFGILYGTTADPNSIYALSDEARYLGVAQVQTASGTSVASNAYVKVQTIYAAQLLDLIEFANTSGTGVLTAAHSGLDLSPREFTPTEPVYKGVSLDTAWTAGPLVETMNGSTEEDWSFSLSTQDLTYVALNNNSMVGVGSLTAPTVTISFNLKVTLAEVDNVSLPQWSVTVAPKASGGYTVTNVNRLTDLTFSGAVGQYSIKWGEAIDGWTYDPANTAPRLDMEIRMLVATNIPPALEGWLSNQSASQLGGAQDASYTTSSGTTVTVDSNTAGSTLGGVPSTPLDQNRISFGGNWSRVGNLTWASNGTVDGTGCSDCVLANVQGGVRFSTVNYEGGASTGLALLMGLSLPGGTSVSHDPDLEADVLLPNIGTSGPLGHLGLIIVLVVVVVAAVVIVAVVVRRKPTRGSSASASLDRPSPSEKSSLDDEKMDDYYAAPR